MRKDHLEEFLQNTPDAEFKRLVAKLKITGDVKRNHRNVNNASLATKIKFKNAVMDAVIDNVVRVLDQTDADPKAPHEEM